MDCKYDRVEYQCGSVTQTAPAPDYTGYLSINAISACSYAYTPEGHTKGSVHMEIQGPQSANAFCV